jgi:HAD superfamily hydrolase (TIGR01549 family)
MNKTSTTFIFDFDGTIADTHYYIIQVSNQLAKEFGYSTILPEEIENLKDKTVQEVIKHLNVPLMKIPAIVARAKKEFQKDIKNLEPINGLKDALSHIKRIGTKIGILSSNAIDNIQSFLELHDLNFFDFVQSTTSIWGKHICLNKLIKKNNLNKDDVVYIGDEMRDISAAKKLGIRVVAVTWGYNSSKALEKLNPDYLCKTPEDLASLANSLTLSQP